MTVLFDGTLWVHYGQAYVVRANYRSCPTHSTGS
jgi:hypothetical protein